MAEIELPVGMNSEDVERILKAAMKKKEVPPEGSYVEFANFESNHEQIRIYRDVYKGRETFSVRKFYQDEEGEWKHGKGLSFHDEDIDEIIAGLEAMKDWCEEHGEGDN